MAERRRLPVLSSSSPSSSESNADDETRPPWHWVGFGTVAIFAAWLPLAYVAGAVSAKMMAARFGADASKDAIDLALRAMTSGERAQIMATVALPNVLGLALAAFAGGVVVGRFGAGPYPARVAALSGAVTAFIASAIAWAGFTAATAIAAIVTFAVAIGFAAWGGRFGASRLGGPRPAS
jgi:tRNA-(ms[2]io[6]A)-hydroxylase